MRFKKFAFLLLCIFTVMASVSACADDGGDDSSAPQTSEPSVSGSSSLAPSEDDESVESSEAQGSETQSSEDASEGLVSSEASATESEPFESETTGEESFESSAVTESESQPITGDSSTVESGDVNDLPRVTLVAKDNGDGTVTVSAILPAGIGNGMIVVKVSDDLTYVEGSGKSAINGYINDNQKDFNGIAVVFASASFFDEGSVAMSATYKLAGGAKLDTDDFWCDMWELGDGTVWVSTSEDCDEIKICR